MQPYQFHTSKMAPAAWCSSDGPQRNMLPRTAGKKDEWAPVNQLVHFSSLSRYIHGEGVVFHAAGSPAPVCGAVKMSPQQNYAVHTIDTIPVSVVTFELHLFCNVEISIVLPFTHQASGDIEIIIFHEVCHGKHTEDCFTLLPVQFTPAHTSLLCCSDFAFSIFVLLFVLFLFFVVM